MVLCAGLGTRLLPLTEELPKPLVPLGDRPLLAHITARLRRGGIDHVVLNTHHLSRAFNSIFEWLDIEAQVIPEPEIRGTAGGVAGARGRLGRGPVLVWNGDIVADAPVKELLALASLGGLALAVAPRPPGQGTVGLAGDGHVVRLRGERFGAEARGGDYVGVCALGERLLRALPERGCMIGDVALPELRRGGQVVSAPVRGHWSDLGDPRSYLEENLRWLGEHGHGDGWMGRGARVAPGVRLDHALVGHGAHVFGRTHLRRVVVWPGAEVKAPLEDAVVLRSGRVVPIA